MDPPISFQKASVIGKKLFGRFYGRPLIRGAVMSLIGNGIGRTASLAASILIAVIYGADIYTDAFYMVFAVMAFFLNLFQGTLDLSFVPVYSEVRSKDVSEARRFLGSLFLSLLILSLAFAVLMDVLVYYLAPSLFAKQSREFVSIAVRLTWEMSPVIIGMAISALFVSLFNAERLFMTAGLMPFFPSFGIILFVLFLKDAWDVHALSLGLLFGTILQFFVLSFYARKKEVRLEWRLHDFNLLKVLKIASLQIVALFLVLILPVIDRILIPFFLRAGDVTAVENASRLCQVPWSLATVGYINVFFSWWSLKSSEGDFTYVKRSFKKLFVFSCAVFVPISLLLFLGSLPIVKIVFGYGKYSDTAIVATSEVFGYYSLGYWAYMLRSTMIRFFSAQQITHVVVKAAIWDFCVHLVVLFLFLEKAGIGAIGIAATGGYVVSLGYLLHYYLKWEKASVALAGYVQG